MTDNRAGRNQYIPALDGLRALAVFAVIGFHLGLPFAPGGFLGVTLFFALSGYLITDLLLSEWARESKISLKAFFVRRAKRLLPAVLFLLAVLSVFVSLFRPDLLENLKSAFLPALFFFSNWHYIFSGTPYFASSGTPSLLNHFWSLAIEAQFYLIWPFLVIAGQRLFRKRWVMIFLTALLAVLSAVLMAVLYHPGTDPSRVYYGTDTRIFSLLLGALLAYLLPSSKIAVAQLGKAARVSLEVVGFAALAAVLFSAYYVTQYDNFLYFGGMFLYSVVSLVLIAASANSSTLIGKVFSIKPLRFIGNISYGVYLWQFPVIAISNLIVKPTSLNVWLILFQIAATILMATFSYYAIEKPIRKKGLIGTIKDGGVSKSPKMWLKKTAVISASGLVLLGGIGLLVVKPVSIQVEDALTALPSEVHSDPSAFPSATGSLTPSASAASPSGALPSASASVSASPSQAASPSPSVTAPPAVSPDDTAQGRDEASMEFPDEPSAAPKPSPSAVPSAAPVTGTETKASDLWVTLIGDSVGIDIMPYLQEYFPKMNVEAKVGRQFYEAKGIISDLIDNGKLAPVVVIELGSNGTVRDSDLSELLDLMGSDRKVVLVNAQVPRSWCADVNATLAKVSAQYPNTVVVDWYSASLGKSDWFYNDGFHPNQTGSPVLAKMIAIAISTICHVS